MASNINADRDVHLSQDVCVSQQILLRKQEQSAQHMDVSMKENGSAISEHENEEADFSDRLSAISDVPDDEIEQMLEEAFASKRTASEAGLDTKSPTKSRCVGAANYEERDKVVLVDKCRNHFDVLPEGWLQVTHNSGMPIYLHKGTRVCTMSRPYFLGQGSARRHEIPLSAVPCLSYRRNLEREAKEREQQEAKGPINAGHELLPSVRIETIKENIERHSLKAEDLREYCKALFQFKNITVTRFRSWNERRQFTKQRRNERLLQRPNLPSGTRLITFPIRSDDHDTINGSGDTTETSSVANGNVVGSRLMNGVSGLVASSSGVGGGAGGGGSGQRREWIMNPDGKSYVCILHEYVQHALKKQPTYKIVELESAGTPYAATVSINDMQYGIGYGTSKKLAKSEAARATLDILIPEMRTKTTASEDLEQDMSFFDEIRIEDPRVAEFCAKTTEPSPHDVLLTCLQRNFGLNNMKITYQGNIIRNKKNQFTMTVGKHSATVVCKNKRDGKQRASQAILQALHPDISSWGALLRLYGSRSMTSFKERKMKEQEITLLQTKAAINSPNYAILNKLKLELGKLKVKRDTNVSLVPPSHLNVCTNLKDLDK